MSDRDTHVNEIMDWFDFRKVAKVMEFLNWKWYFDGIDGVPAEGDIRALARQLMNEAYDRAVATGKNYQGGTGGFYIEVDMTDDEPWIKLSFILNEWRSPIV